MDQRRRAEHYLQSKPTPCHAEGTRNNARRHDATAVAVPSRGFVTLLAWLVNVHVVAEGTRAGGAPGRRLVPGLVDPVSAPVISSSASGFLDILLYGNWATFPDVDVTTICFFNNILIF
jgi:hypothetical protein